MIDSKELNELWRNEEITPEAMREELLQHDSLRQYEVERLAAICKKSARGVIASLKPITINKRKYVYLTSEVRQYLRI